MFSDLQAGDQKSGEGKLKKIEYGGRKSMSIHFSVEGLG